MFYLIDSSYIFLRADNYVHLSLFNNIILQYDQINLLVWRIILYNDNINNNNNNITFLELIGILLLSSVTQYSKVPDRMLYTYMTCTVCIYSAITTGHVIILPLWVYYYYVITGGGPRIFFIADAILIKMILLHKYLYHDQYWGKKQI